MNAVSVNQLSVNYDKTPVLWDLSFSVPKGIFTGIIGPNGAGKSTLIKTLLGLITPISGKVLFFDKPLATLRQKIGYMPQRESIDWDFPISVLDLVLMGRYGKLGLFRRPRRADRDAALSALETVGMENYAQRQISQLSGGQQQRVFLARALLQEADIYFMDEPFAGIDHATESVMIELLRRLVGEGKTIFAVHHDLNSVVDYFDWVLLLNMRLIACGPTKTTFTAENLHAAYGKSYALFGEAFKLSRLGEP